MKLLYMLCGSARQPVMCGGEKHLVFIKVHCYI